MKKYLCVVAVFVCVAAVAIVVSRKASTPFYFCKADRTNIKKTKYDKNSNLVYVINSYGTETWYKYDKRGNKIYVKYKVPFVYAYDSETFEDKKAKMYYEEEEKYEYDKNGNKIYEKDRYGKETWYEYNERGRLVYEKDEYGKETWRRYNESGNLVYDIDSYGRGTWYEYDRNGNKIYKANIDGRNICKESWYEYDESGNLVYDIDSYGRGTWYEYDENGNKIYVKYKGPAEYVYDESEKKMYVTKGTGVYEYDSETFEDKKTGMYYKEEEKYEYDKNGNTIYEKDRDGNEIWRQYNESGNLVYKKQKYKDYHYVYENLLQVKTDRYDEVLRETKYDANGKYISEREVVGDVEFLDARADSSNDYYRVPIEVSTFSSIPNYAKYKGDYTNYEYDDEGKKIYGLREDDGAGYYATWYEFADNGNLIVAKYSNGGSYRYEYDAQSGRLVYVHEISPQNAYHTFVFSDVVWDMDYSLYEVENGKTISAKHYPYGRHSKKWYEYDAQDKFNFEDVYEYNAQGLLSSIEYYKYEYKSGKVEEVKKAVFRYNENCRFPDIEYLELRDGKFYKSDPWRYSCLIAPSDFY